MLGELARDRHAQAVRDDAARLGIEIVWRQEHRAQSQGAGDRFRQLVQLAVTGETQTRVSEVVLHRMAVGGSRMLYVQTFARDTALPAYLHARLPGAFSTPVTLRRKLIGVAWHAQDAAGLASRLDSAPGLKAAAKGLPWKKHSTLGHVDLEWTLQVRSLGDQTSELVFQLGSTAFDLYGTCLDRCLELREALRPVLAGEQAPAQRQGLYWPAPYADLYYEILCDPS